MSLIGQTRSWLRNVFRRAKAEREMQLEMSAHIQQAAERFVACGMSERDALHAAHREFGPVAVLQEQARDSRGGRWVNDLTTDLKYAMRYFARTPLTSLTIVFTLLLGIGLNAAAYSFAQGYFYNPPPGMPNDPGLVEIRGTERVQGYLQKRSFSYPELRDFAAQPVFSAVAGWTSSSVLLDLGDGAEGVVSAVGLYVTPNYFSTLNLRLAAGAGFVQSRFDDIKDAELTTVVTHSFASSHFGNAANAIGKRVRINDAIVTIVGVAPPRFIGVDPFTQRRLFFLPMSALNVLEKMGASAFTHPDSSLFRAAARLQPDISVDRVQPIVASVGARHVAMHNAANRSLTDSGVGREQVGSYAGGPGKQKDNITDVTTSVRLLQGRDDVSTGKGQTITVSLLFATLDLVILLVCITTVSSLLVGAAVTRRHEIGVRLALGASRWRIVRQLVTETAILSLCGAVGGLTLYYILTRAALAAQIPIDISVKWHTALFTAFFSVTVAMLCGLSPALHATRQGLSDVLKDASLGATSRSKLQRVFVIAQIAFAQPLLVLLGMTVAQLYMEYSAPIETTLADKLVVAQFDRYAARNYSANDASIAAISRRIAGVSGVTGVILRPNTISMYSSRAIELNGARSPGKLTKVMVNSISAEYLDLLGIEVIAGRLFVPSDTMNRVRPLIVRTDFAEKMFGGGNPIGRRICHYYCKTVRDTMEVIGVVAMAVPGLHESGSGLHAFTLSDASESSSLLIRTSVAASAIIPMIRSIARFEAPKLPVVSILTISDLEAKEWKPLIQAASATAGAGMLTLLLACIGLYAVVALGVRQRRREIGIRIALGARPSAVVALFFKGGLWLSVIGLAIGLPLGAATLRLLTSKMGSMQGNPFVISISIAIIVLLVASLATWLPARKAAGVDPLSALRAE